MSSCKPSVSESRCTVPDGRSGVFALPRFWLLFLLAALAALADVTRRALKLLEDPRSDIERPFPVQNELGNLVFASIEVHERDARERRIDQTATTLEALGDMTRADREERIRVTAETMAEWLKGRDVARFEHFEARFAPSTKGDAARALCMLLMSGRVKIVEEPEGPDGAGLYYAGPEPREGAPHA